MAIAEGDLIVADASEDLILGSFPTVNEFLTRQKWPDGGDRVTGTISLSWEHGIFKAACNDRDGGLVAFASDASLSGLFTTLEKGLDNSSLDWRASKWDKRKTK